MTSLVSFVQGLQKGAMTTFIYNTEARMNKGGRAQENYLYGRVRKQTRTSAMLGADYGNCVNNLSERVGSGEHIVAEKPNGMSWTIPQLILHSDDDENQLYICMTIDKRSVSETFYFVDGRPATEEEMSVIKKYLVKSGTSQKQAALGIDEKDQIKPRHIKVENVLLVKQGAKVWKAQ